MVTDDCAEAAPANAPRTARAKRDFFISYSKYCYLSKYFYRPTTPYCPLDNGTYLNKKHTGGTTATQKNSSYDNDVTFFCNVTVRRSFGNALFQRGNYLNGNYFDAI